MDITSYLPEETALVLASDAKVEMTVRIEPVQKKSFEVPVTNLTVENLRDGYELEFDEDTVAVEISGPESIIGALKAKGIQGAVNANGMGSGSHRLTVELFLEQYCWLTENVRVPVTITGNATEAGGAAGENPAEGTDQNPAEGVAPSPGQNTGTQEMTEITGPEGETAPAAP